MCPTQSVCMSSLLDGQKMRRTYATTHRVYLCFVEMIISFMQPFVTRTACTAAARMRELVIVMLDGKDEVVNKVIL